MQCPYCDRKFVDEEWTLRHVEREHAAEWAIDNDPGPTATEPREERRPGKHRWPARTRAHRHKWTRTGEFADPSKPFASEVCLTCGSAERVYGRPEYSRPIPTIQVRRCPGPERNQEDRGWQSQFNNECGVVIPEDRTRCMFHSRA